jgi:hypothetical protein
MRYDATANAIEATGLVKRFGKTTALDGVGRIVGPEFPGQRGHRDDTPGVQREQS